MSEEKHMKFHSSAVCLTSVPPTFLGGDEMTSQTMSSLAFIISSHHFSSHCYSSQLLECAVLAQKSG